MILKSDGRIKKGNEYSILYERKIVVIRIKNKGRFLYSIISLCDFPMLREYKFCVQSNFKGDKGSCYLITNIKKDSKIITDSFHSLIGMNDHINRIALDNRRENLRKCTHSENCYNRVRPNTSNIIGVQLINLGKPNESFTTSITYKRVKYTRGFSTGKYGFENARQLAIDWKKAKAIELGVAKFLPNSELENSQPNTNSTEEELIDDLDDDC